MRKQPLFPASSSEWLGKMYYVWPLDTRNF
jgi:hypothetical protein